MNILPALQNCRLETSADCQESCFVMAEIFQVNTWDAADQKKFQTKNHDLAEYCQNLTKQLDLTATAHDLDCLGDAIRLDIENLIYRGPAERDWSPKTRIACPENAEGKPSFCYLLRQEMPEDSKVTESTTNILMIVRGKTSSAETIALLKLADICNRIVYNFGGYYRLAVHCHGTAVT